MNFKKVILYLIIIAMILMAFAGYRIFRNDESSNGKIILEISTENHAWDNVYSGVAIIDNGDIYRFNFGGNDYYDYANNKDILEAESNYILNNSKKLNQKISSNDIKTIKECLKYFRDETHVKQGDFVVFDAGKSGDYVWDYNKNKKCILTEWDCGDTQVNETDNAKRIEEILSNYDIEIYE